MIRAGVRATLLAVVAVTVLLLLLMIVSPSLAWIFLFHPDPTDPGPPPELAGVEGDALTLRADDGVSLRAWWYGATPSAGTVVVFHGNAGNLGDRTHLAHEFLRRGFSVLLAGYRGYGGSEGRPDEEGLYLDGRAAFAFARERTGDPARVALLGRSLGGAVAAAVAAGSPAEPPGALILDSTFTSLDRIGMAVYPFLPRFVFRGLQDVFPTRQRVARLEHPLLVIHGEEDRLVPVAMGKELYESARGPRAWYGVPGAGHNDLLAVAGSAYFDEVEDFLRDHLPSGR